MNRIISQHNARFWVAVFLSAIFLNLVVGCNYYKIKTRNHDDIDFSEKLNKSLNRENLVLFIQPGKSYLAKKIDFDQQSITVELDTIPHELIAMHEELEQSTGRRFNRAKQKAIVHEVRIYPNENTQLEKGNHTILVSDINKVDIYDHDTASEILSWTAVAAGILGVMVLIVALTKSSCPYVYSFNGENYVLEGESYGGAIFKPLERMDYLPLKGIDSIERIKTVRIANQLKERQYINQVKMVELQTNPGVSALLDKYGRAFTFENPHPPIKAMAGQKDFSEQLSSVETGNFIFDTGDSENSHIDLYFPNQHKEGKLIINAKGSLWLDYMYGEFSKLFGDSYPAFIHKQHKRPANELKQWIQDQDLLLSVYEHTQSGWQLIDQFDMVGPLGDGRDMVMSIPANSTAGDTRTFRLETGFMFWDLNYAAIDYSPNRIIKLGIITPFRALDQNGIDRNELITRDDSRYLEQMNIGDVVTTNFETSDPGFHLTTHYFLAVKGYYEHVREFEGGPQLDKLIMFRVPGYFTEYSRISYQSMQLDFVAAKGEAF